MRLVEALEILRRPSTGNRSPFGVSLVCGFEPLHLRTFLAAKLTQALPLAAVEVSTGVFDDLLGNVQRAARLPVEAMAVVVEWPDIDPRLGLRRLGGWRPTEVADIAGRAEPYLEVLERELIQASADRPVVCCPPTLPLPALFPQRPDESGAEELRIRNAVGSFAARLAQHGGVRVCSGQWLDERSPPPDRRDVQAELTAGFPYSLGHAAEVAELLARLIYGPPPKKGLITDLDDTVWAGIAGEVGASNVSWSLDSHTHRHALYQQFLTSLANAGVLVGIASKNDPRVVDEVFERTDLVLDKEAVFPLEVSWGPKSGSIERILDVWNISADAVVFVDNSPIELDEARNRFSDLVTVRFPGHEEDDDRLWPFLHHLRTLFGKSTASTEDRLRIGSIRSASEHRGAGGEDDFLARVSGSIEFSSDGAHEARALELINKTNQFNLNGRRLTEAALRRALSGKEARLLTASYADTYGPLGIVAALVVAPGQETLTIETWVMSCRAFSRRIEHHCLEYLFESFGVGEITADYLPTGRNGALGEFLCALLGKPPDGSVSLTRRGFEEHAPALVHRVSEVRR
jgi:FkbH-like protein